MIRILKYQSYFVTKLLHIIVFIVDILTIYIDMTARRAKQAVEKLRQSRFTGTGMSDDSDELTLFNFQINIFESLNLIRSALTVTVIYFIKYNG